MRLALIGGTLLGRIIYRVYRCLSVHNRFSSKLWCSNRIGFTTLCLIVAFIAIVLVSLESAAHYCIFSFIRLFHLPSSRWVHIGVWQCKRACLAWHLQTDSAFHGHLQLLCLDDTLQRVERPQNPWSTQRIHWCLPKLDLPCNLGYYHDSTDHHRWIWGLCLLHPRSWS